MKMRLMPVLAVSVALVALLAVGAGQAFATHVECGETITEDTTLDSDLLDCPPYLPKIWPPAITIGADDVTLDLNGHTISSNIDPHGNGTVGIRNDAYDRVSVLNGTITGYEFPIGMSGDANSITNVTVQGRYGVRLSGTNSEIRNSAVLSGREGAVELFGAGPYLIEKNFLHGRCGICGYSAAVYLIRKNLLPTDGDTAISLQLVSGSAVEHNIVTEGGIFVRGTGFVAHNRLKQAGGITAFDSVTVARNHVVGSSGNGITAFDSVTVADNTANYNANLGIEADPTVIDGGGNRAKGNGNPLQCVNVFCK